MPVHITLKRCQASAISRRKASPNLSSRASSRWRASPARSAGLASAIIGPQLVRHFTDALAPTPFAGAYVATIFLNLAGVWVFWLLDSPRPAPPAASCAPRPSTSWPSCA